MLRIMMLVLISAFCSSYAQITVKTININRTFFPWKDSGIECFENKNYWYLFKNSMDSEIKKQVRFCGGSIIEFATSFLIPSDEIIMPTLYYQRISVSCDSIAHVLSMDSNFINLNPFVAEEKISGDIFFERDLFYVDSQKLIFKASIIFYDPVSDDVKEYLKSCVDSVEEIGNRIWVYGDRKDMLCVASSDKVQLVFDVKREGPVNINNFSKIIPVEFNKLDRYNLLGRRITLSKYNPKNCVYIDRVIGINKLIVKFK